jgi:hypothetical protein
MAKQKGIIKLRGTIGDITFFKTKDGDMFAREKSSVDGDRILKDPAFIRTRENGKEFGAAGRDAKLIRDAFNSNLVSAKDHRTHPRLVKLLMQITKLDATSVRGGRTVGTAIVSPTAMGLLKGFNFNINAQLTEILKKPYALNLATGVITINGLIPVNDLLPPEGATHVTLRGAWGKIDFVNKQFNVSQTNSVNLVLNGTSTNVTLTPTAAPTGAGTNIFLLQVEFFQLVNTVQYSLKNGAHNALSIIGVS